MCKYLSEQMDYVFVSRKINKNYNSLSQNLKDGLYSEFLKNPYPKASNLKSLSEKFHLSKDKIRNWFKYQRKKDFRTKRLIITKYKKNNSFPKEKRIILESYFRMSPDLTKENLIELSKKLECRDIFIKRWYYYRNKKLHSLIADSSQHSEQTHTLPIISKVEERPKIIKEMNISNVEEKENASNYEKISKEAQLNNSKMAFNNGIFNYMSNYSSYYAFLQALLQKQNIENQLSQISQMTQNTTIFNPNMYLLLNLASRLA